ncbi:MAG: 3-hydroxyacyl-CoA dehydrogenase NAD-binding domain-containing protein [Candidatus Omnitrophota bacterium]
MVQYFNKAGLGIIEFNDPDSKVNVLSISNLTCLERILTDISSNTHTIKALFFTSPKKDIFIAGADLKELASIKTKKAAIDLCAKGQAICNRIERLSVPTFAIVDGACIGGGLELALSCDYILVTANKKTVIGFPESRLGISPGFGGAHRLKERIGAKKARYLIDTGQLLTAREAKKIRVIDGIITKAIARDYKILSGFARRRKRSIPNRGQGLDKQEREILAEKIMREPARNALSAFLLVSKYKNRVSEDSDILETLGRCAVIGAGIMGRDIAYLVSLETGLPVSITDLNKTISNKARTHIKSLYRDAVKRGILYRDEAGKKLKNISFCIAGMRDCGIIIECVTEDFRLKKQVFAEIESKVRPDCIIATNTSCLSVEELGRTLKRPERFVGMHFFNPAYKMKLVEVIPASFTDKTVMEKVNTFLRNMRRVPVIVKDRPGFLVNRMLLPYLNEAVFMLEEGFSRIAIDSAMIDFGMPKGPVELLEDIGLGVAYRASKILEDKVSDCVKVPVMLEAWADRKKILRKKETKKAPASYVTQRLLGPIKKEAELCLNEGIADSQEIIDLTLLLGIGFPVSKRIWNV